MANVLSLLSGMCCGRHTASGPLCLSLSKQGIVRKKEVWTPSSYIRLSKLECGNFGEIFLVRNTRSDNVAVLKVVNTLFTEVDRVENERNSWQMTCEHPHIVTLIAYFETSDTFNFISEFMPGGNLYKFVRKEGPIELTTAKMYAGQIGSAIEHIHNKGITHRDISAKNVLISAEGDVRLTDFGFAMFKKNSSRVCGTPLYMAPEMVKKKMYDKAVDWWSYGIVIYLMLMGKTPLEVGFDNSPDLPYLEEMDDSTLMKVGLTVELMFPIDIASLPRDFITELLRKDPKQRLGSSKKPVKEHTFLEGVPWPEI